MDNIVWEQNPVNYIRLVYVNKPKVIFIRLEALESKEWPKWAKCSVFWEHEPIKDFFLMIICHIEEDFLITLTQYPKVCWQISLWFYLSIVEIKNLERTRFNTPFDWELKFFIVGSSNSYSVVVVKAADNHEVWAIITNRANLITLQPCHAILLPSFRSKLCAVIFFIIQLLKNIILMFID